MGNQDYIVKKLRQIEILPTFPKIVSEILALISDPMSSASDLARHMDPSMAGEVLRIANTAYFGTRSFRSITTMERAIAVIGYEHLGYIVLQMPFLGMIQGADTTFNKKLFITHAIVCGSLAKLIGAYATAAVDQNEVYVSGILHDIGRIIMYRYFKKEWQEVLALIKEEHMPAVEAERAVYSVDHGQVGASLLELWNLPSAIVDGVRYHHVPEAAQQNRESAFATHLANQFAKRIDIDTDLENFDDFAARHREFCQAASESTDAVTIHDEIKFLSSAYDSLKSAKGLIEVTAGDDDTGSGC
jgi:putative nucleotidyltransferase with HDIG domain